MSLENFAIGLMFAVAVALIVFRLLEVNGVSFPVLASNEDEEEIINTFPAATWADLQYSMMVNRVEWEVRAEEAKKCPYCRGKKTRENPRGDIECSGCGAIR